MRHLLYIAPVMLALWFLDSAISEDRYVGWERNSVRNSAHRWHANKTNQVILLGSSTSVDWARPHYIGKLLGVSGRKVLDAHINGCHQGCTYAEVRYLLQRERHFKTAFYGTNLFQICEYEHSKRSLQHEMMLPTRDIPRMFALYARAEQPLNYMARFIGNELSGAYGDTAILRHQWTQALFGEAERGQEHRWIRAERPPRAPFVTCDYAPEHVAYKKAVSEALLDDLGALADQVFLMLLPDETLSSPDPAIRAAWIKHRALHRELAAARPHVTLIDLTEGGARDRRHFRDGFHVNKTGMRLQQRRFEALMRAGGHAR